MIINIEKRYFFIIFGLFVLAVGIFLVYALASSIDTSQAYHESNQVSISVSGVEKTLQEAIDAGDFEGAEADSIPSGFCIFSRTQSGCPSGWSRDAGFDSRTIRGVEIPDGTGGGSESHSHTGTSHTHSLLSGASFSGSDAVGRPIGSGPSYDNRLYQIGPDAGLSGNYVGKSTVAGGTGATSSTSSWPPYVNVIICCKD